MEGVKRDRDAACIELDALLDDMPQLPTLAELVRAYVHRALEVTGNNKTKAARVLQIHRSRLRRIAEGRGNYQDIEPKRTRS